MKTNQQSWLKKAAFSSVLLSSLVASSSLFADCNAFITRTTPDASFQDNLDGTVTSLETGLMWQKCSQGQSWNTGSNANNPADDSCDDPVVIELTWQAALDAAQSANDDTALGYDDWYLPNIKELNSLVERACRDPAINSSLFPATMFSYWSASLGRDDRKAWYVSHNGIMEDTSKSHTRSVRLVRVSP